MLLGEEGPELLLEVMDEETTLVSGVAGVAISPVGGSKSPKAPVDVDISAPL